MTTETILTDDAIARILSKKYGYPVDEVFRADHSAARAIEQAVLQSAQVQAWKRDAERWRTASEHWKVFKVEVLPRMTIDNSAGIPWRTLTDQADAAKEQQT